MKNILIVLLFLSFGSFGQGYVNFGPTRINDTARDLGGLLVAGKVRLPTYATNDTNAVAGWDAGGNITRRTKSTSSGSGITLSQLNDSLSYYLALWKVVSNLSSPNSSTVINTSGLNTVLSGYQLKGDSTRYSTVYRNDTGNANLRAQIAGIPTSADSAVFYTVYRSDTSRRAIYAQLDLKLKISDTGAMLASYMRRSDSTIYASWYNLDTTRRNLYALADTKVKYTDTATMLVPYMKKSDSALYQTTYRSDTNRVNVLAYIATKGTGQVNAVVAGTNSNMSATGTTTVTIVADTTAYHLATKTDLLAFTTQTVTAASYTTSVTITSSIASPMSTVRYKITAQAGALLFAAPTGSWADGQLLNIAVYDNGTIRALTYNSAFSGATKPTTTVVGEWTEMLFIYNSSASNKFQFMGTKQTAN